MKRIIGSNIIKRIEFKNDGWLIVFNDDQNSIGVPISATIQIFRDGIDTNQYIIIEYP